MSLPVQCFNCQRFSVLDAVNDPEDAPEEYLGQCNWPNPTLPHSWRYAQREVVWVWGDEGEKCACFVEKTV